MRLAIIGNAPSLVGAGCGDEIDSYDRVCRLKGGCTLIKDAPDDYGVKLDYISSTFKIGALFKDFPIEEYWGYVNNPKIKCPDIKIFKPKVRLELEAVNHWLRVYESLINDRDVEPWFSTGMGAIVIACASGMFESITLLGFDNLLSGEVSAGINIFRDDTFVYPKHAWDIENKMLSMLSDYYHISIGGRDAENVRRT